MRIVNLLKNEIIDFPWRVFGNNDETLATWHRSPPLAIAIVWETEMGAFDVVSNSGEWWFWIDSDFPNFYSGFNCVLAGVELFHGFVPCAAPKNVCYAQVGGWEHNSLNTMCTTGSSRRVFGLLWRVPALQCKLKTKTNRITAAAARHPLKYVHTLSLAVSVGITLSSVAGERQRASEREMNWTGHKERWKAAESINSMELNLIYFVECNFLLFRFVLFSKVQGILLVFFSLRFVSFHLMDVAMNKSHKSNTSIVIIFSFRFVLNDRATMCATIFPLFFSLLRLHANGVCWWNVMCAFACESEIALSTIVDGMRLWGLCHLSSQFARRLILCKSF